MSRKFTPTPSKNPEANPIKVIAVDPGYDKLGIAILEKEKGGKERLIFSECFSPKIKLAGEEKLLSVGREIERLIKQFRPGYLALEKVFFNQNQKTVMKVAEVRGVIIYEAKSFGLDVYQYTPLEVKVAATSYGRSSKSEVAGMVRKIIGINDRKARIDDEYDAIAVGLTFFAYFRP
ncbi:MAG: crossover junction endodeoxyribonuclease RuvC [Parcubacteria group bacterium Gr01-1014_107]|nr:MAG: crossover junction endodeoxyribonuclease RuvC [Parcubacteria group bacterium Gr01-1014_107]